KKVADCAFFSPEKSPAFVREYDAATDKAAVEELERRCEVGGKTALVTDLMGDPLARVRNFSSHIMLVGEIGAGREIVGIIRGCIKTVTFGRKGTFVKLGYILGLRVSPTYRRLGIARKLVEEMEGWFIKNGAEYSYMATESNNLPSLNLFTKRCNYARFRNLTVLVQPVHHHRHPLPSDVHILRLPPALASSVYRRLFRGSDFFPQDIDRLLDNDLNLGTFMAVRRRRRNPCDDDDDDDEGRTAPDPSSSPFAVLSVWNTKEVFRLRVKGASPLTRLACRGTRLADAMAPWLRIPSVPNVFESFGFYFVYGVCMGGGEGCEGLMRALCRWVHDRAGEDEGCKAVVAEVEKSDEAARRAIPHWRRFSWDDDVWCGKKLGGDDDDDDDEWCMDPSPSSLFVDPRDV
ncbi:hypothetical protein M569_14864, partial [Genlisea aurea]